MSIREDADERARDLRDFVDLVVEHGDVNVTETLADALSLAYRLSQMADMSETFAETHGKLTSKLYALRKYWKENMLCDPTEFPRALAALSLSGTSRQFIQKEATKSAREFETLFFHIVELSQSDFKPREPIH